MIQSYKGRPIAYGMNVRVYRNLHKAQWSIQHKGLVIGHADALWIENASFKVSQAGRERVIREGRKNVHAFIEGTLSFNTAPREYVRTRITYSPFRQDGFRLDGTESNLIHVNRVHLDRHGQAWSIHPLDIGAPQHGR